ncbi:MAG: TonB-dependent receptor plug domain-containing protein [Gemmatimonadales bacterium]
MNRGGACLLALALALGCATGAAAQVDSTRQDTTTAIDSTKPAGDTLPALLPAFGAAIAPGPLPLGMRYTFTSDSLIFTSARTLSDLLGHIPGVYVARGGWFGQAEIPLYGGRGAAGLEIYWDGVPMLPIGRDSIYLDPARIPLGPIERVDVVVLPARLQVYLVTAQAHSTAPRTQVGIVSGVQDIADYRAGYAIRSRTGVGIALLADWNSIGAGPSNSSSTSFGASDIWVKADYIPPGGRVGASFQLSSSSWHRNPGFKTDGWRQDRRDRLLRVFVAGRDDGLGWRLSGTLATSTVSHDTAVAPRAVSMAIVEASQAWPRATISAIARLGAAGAPQQLEARAGWTPLAPLTLTGAFRQTVYRGQRAGVRAYGAASLALPLHVSARVEADWQHDAQAALVATDQVQQTLDAAAWLRFDNRWITAEVGRGRRDPFAPLGFAEGIQTVDSLGPTPSTEFIAGHATIHVVPGLQLSGWYFDPLVGGGDFEPPRHARISATFYSKFWRVFKSGIFALRAEVAMESWSRSPLGGLDAGGAQRAMTGSSFVDTDLQMQLAGVTLFWTIQNINVMRSSYVEDLSFPKAAQQYGARWFFNN